MVYAEKISKNRKETEKDYVIHKNLSGFGIKQMVAQLIEMTTSESKYLIENRPSFDYAFNSYQIDTQKKSKKST